MKAASKYAYLKKAPASKAQPQLHRFNDFSLPKKEERDTNVISITFDSLKSAEDNIQMGDAHFCKSCRCCLTSTSKLFTKDEYIAAYPSGTQVPDEKNADDLEEEKEEKKIDAAPVVNKNVVLTAISDDEKVWVCEFCGAHNLLDIELEEVPKTDDVIYLLKSAQQLNKGPSDLNSDVTTVFCIDNSGSMSVTCEVKGKHDLKHGLSEEEYEMLKQFIEYGADQTLPNQNKNNTFISRKQCVLAAIEEQLLAMKSDFPNRKVGLVTFDSEVSVIGDGKNVPETVTGDKLYKYDVLRQIGEGLGDKLIACTVKDSAENLIKKFEKLKESGKTALGPALLVSLGLALKGKQGSRVILCTDGLANVGLGEMDTPEGLSKADDFYSDLAMIAKENGVSVSVISIKGEGCKLDILGKVADLTSGSLTRVDPNEITGKFASIMKQEIVGTQVDVKLRLNSGMRFRGEEPELLKEGDSLFEKNVGNVTADTELTFEYEMKPDEQLSMLGLNSEKMETIPFQAQITYTSANGDRLMRVLTKVLKTTHNLAEAERDLDVNLLAARALQHQANFAAKGMYSMSNQIGEAWGDYLENNNALKADKKQYEVVSKYQAKNMKIQAASNKRKEKAESTISTKGFFEQAKDTIQKKAAGLFSSKAAAPSSVIMEESRNSMKSMSKGNMRKIENKSESVEDEDEDYELFHGAKNCNSNF